MISKTLQLVLVFILGFQAQTTDKVTYIANEGFIIEVNEKKIAIDALFNTMSEGWAHSPSQQTVGLMKEAKNPFDNIDVIAVTHFHRDHFNSEVVVNHMLKNSKVQLVCPNQVIEELKNNPNYAKFKDRVISITPKRLQDSIISIAGIQIRVLRLEHGHYMVKGSDGVMTNRHKNVENIGFVFDLKGFKIFHCGDTNPLNEQDYATFELNKQQIDLAFLDRGFYAYEKADIIDRYIAPKQIVLMHIAPNNMALYKEYFKDQKNIRYFENKMDFFELNTKKP